MELLDTAQYQARRLMSAVNAALTAGVTTWNGKALIPSLQYEWDKYEHRLQRYAYYDDYYNNTIYTSYAKYSEQKKQTDSLYRHQRGIYNPVNRLVEIYVSKVYGGQLDLTELTGGAIPIIPGANTSDALLDALRSVWIDSNWQTQKSLYVRYGARLGDVFLKVFDDRRRSKVRMEVLHPGIFKDVQFDSSGNVKACTIEYEKTDEETGKTYVYTEIITKQKFYTFRDNDPFAYFQNARGEDVAEWDNEYGFVPVVKAAHKDTGLGWGAPAMHGSLEKIDEINDAASVLNDAIRKRNKPIWFAAGVGKTELADQNPDVRDAVPMLFGNKDASLTALALDIDISGAVGNIEALLSELERDMPELALHKLREGGNATAPGVKAVYSDASDRIAEADGNYDDALMRAQKMAISIGGHNRYPGYEGFNLDSYDNGLLDHGIKPRPIIDDELSKSERFQFTLQALDSPAPALLLKQLDYSESEVDEAMAAIESRNNQFSLTQFSTLADTVDDPDETPEDAATAVQQSNINPGDIAGADDLLSEVA